ncbi:hypothetical protein AB0J52_36695 [Spirillospora sp. NPDC049652]
MTGAAPTPAPAAGADTPSPADLAERVAAAVTALPDVAGLSTGRSAMLVTYRVGTPVTGVAVRDDAVEIGVVARYGRPLERIADEVRAVAEPLADERRVDVLIADITDEPGVHELGPANRAALPGGEPAGKRPAGKKAGGGKTGETGADGGAGDRAG